MAFRNEHSIPPLHGQPFSTVGGWLGQTSTPGYVHPQGILRRQNSTILPSIVIESGFQTPSGNSSTVTSPGSPTASRSIGSANGQFQCFEDQCRGKIYRDRWTFEDHYLIHTKPTRMCENCGEFVTTRKRDRTRHEGSRKCQRKGRLRRAAIGQEASTVAQGVFSSEPSNRSSNAISNGFSAEAQDERRVQPQCWSILASNSQANSSGRDQSSVLSAEPSFSSSNTAHPSGIRAIAPQINEFIAPGSVVEPSEALHLGDDINLDEHGSTPLINPEVKNFLESSQLKLLESASPDSNASQLTHVRNGAYKNMQLPLPLPISGRTPNYTAMEMEAHALYPPFYPNSSLASYGHMNSHSYEEQHRPSGLFNPPSENENAFIRGESFEEAPCDEERPTVSAEQCTEDDDCIWHHYVNFEEM
ncbi:hypothetical protein DFH27DRAFT_84455 [Peziza echinospora]|nr:hypothetical protein DFH27DRAFT_84455 [Peziza echinospora]